MNKWISISIICVLVAGIAASLFLYFQESSNLKTAESEIVTLEGNVSTLESDLAAAQAEATMLEGELSTAEAEVSRLEGDLATAEAEVTRLEGELAAEEAEVSRLEGELAAAQAEISTLEADLAAADAEVTRLEGELSDTQAEVSTLQADLAAAQAEVSTLSEELNKVKYPRHFVELKELTSWLEHDDTDTEYAAKSPIELAFILQVEALRDGYLLPAFFEGINYDGTYDVNGNLAYIRMKFYVVFPDDDSVIEWGYGPFIPHFPLPPEQDQVCSECHFHHSFKLIR